jgi:hypothetical protein
MPCRITSLLALAVVFSLALLGGPEPAATDRIKKIPLVEIEIRALSESEPRPHSLMLKADRPARVQFEAGWDEIGNVRVELTGRAEATGDADARTVRLQAILTLPDGRRIQASREALIKERSTILFELFRHDDRPFTLALTVQISQTLEVIHTPSFGSPVRFEIEVMRVEGNTPSSLERNMLNTFENETVRYEFTLGPDLTTAALTLSLTPVRLIGDMVEINVNIEGRLPGDDGVTVIARDENFVVNRGAMLPVDVTIGDPPVGYRFQVTTLF